MADAKSFVVFEKRKGYAVIRWNRPARKNAILTEMQTEATKHLKQTITDDSVKLIVLTGTGEYFTSGADFLTTVNADSTSEEHIRAVLQTFKDLIDCLIDFPKPIIAAVNGPAIGMGVSTLPLCDIVYASSNSTFLTPFSRIGMTPEACSSYTFPKIMGYSKATEMLVFNRKLSASEAHSHGLVSDVFHKETFMKEVYKRVHEFVDNPKKCLIYGKTLIRERDRTLLHRINAEEVERLVERFMSDDVREQAMKFIQKRLEMKQRRNAKL